MFQRTIPSRLGATLVAALAFGTLPALADGSRNERTITLELASEIAAGAVNACTALGFNVTAAVVDRQGTLRALMRADNAGPHTVAASQAKAYTSASARNTTSAILLAAQSNPAAATLVDIPGFLVLGGGVPIRHGNEVIGAVGVAGAPGGQFDEQCANTAIAGGGKGGR